MFDWFLFMCFDLCLVKRWQSISVRGVTKLQKGSDNISKQENRGCTILNQYPTFLRMEKMIQDFSDSIFNKSKWKISVKSKYCKFIWINSVEFNWAKFKCPKQAGPELSKFDCEEAISPSPTSAQMHPVIIIIIIIIYHHHHHHNFLTSRI